MNPNDLLNLLNEYFQAALACIHDEDGTVMDLVGDAIFALWNAPVDQPDHRERACRAALRLRERLIEFHAGNRGFALRTRVGLHTGMVCIGNIGSERRFDYAAVGDNTNLASRLEGLNKHFGTDMLASRDVQQAVEAQLTSRLVGHVRVKGFAKAIEVHEIIGDLNAAHATQPWREMFARALQHFRNRDFETARELFQSTIELRKQTTPPGAKANANAGGDGPSLFYLRTIEELRKAPPAEDWIGEITMKDK
jgi:adenylate cyclase